MHFIDIHTHFLPGLDDGPRTIDETVEMLRVAHAGETRSIVATPHMFHESFDLFDPVRVEDCFAKTVEDLEKRSQLAGHEFLADLELCLGAENYASPTFLDALEKDRALTLNGSRYVLVEFDLNLPAGHFLNVAERVLARGLVPVLAHVERYAAVRRDADLLARLLDKGCLTQVNAESFEGSFWSKGKRFALDLLDHDLVSIIASDSHGAHYRPPGMSETYYKLAGRFGEEKVGQWMSGHPRWAISRGNSV